MENKVTCDDSHLEVSMSQHLFFWIWSIWGSSHVHLWHVCTIHPPRLTFVSTTIFSFLFFLVVKREPKNQTCSNLTKPLQRWWKILGFESVLRLLFNLLHICVTSRFDHFNRNGAYFLVIVDFSSYYYYRRIWYTSYQIIFFLGLTKGIGPNFVYWIIIRTNCH